ncbi:MAG: UDP-N-acetylmuramoylalanyl-D-glutamyl-2, 6-diaminopimelate--D-alanyl-D-alanine ligase [Alphaproteobacteria bacterium 13_2_20CM_2_64_7]|jgi:UDP-N-acetylmuramoyl-tripeptide--D-alanyl-D-alanine ligase|nr:MAG: UDP-N-acetylmuramoylalanyl-D-glutamyl-2, 6-diaminopimelate--D-alanyl-D-alanine ligase [Alphaproteobacteria bacterium 13_2_20CM_2_64_7]
MIDRPLWSVEAMLAAMRAAPAGPLPSAVPGISIDTRTIAPGEAFFAIKGDTRDGHDFVQAALEARAGLAVVAAGRRDDSPQNAPLLIVPDVLEGLRDLARAARARARAKIVAVTGSVGKTGTKEALRLALGRSGETHTSVASYNNHWGVPLSLARCPESARYAVFEIGMNHAGEIEPLTRLVRPQVAIITAVEPVHLEFFDSLEAIADAKAEIFLGVERGGAAVINRDSPQFARLERSARNAGVERVVSFGEHARADAKLIKCSLRSDMSTVQARILGADITYKLGAPGRHLVINSLAVLAAAALVGADLALAALELAELQPASGRGSRLMLHMPGGSALLIDESYNANPASMRAALALLGQAKVGPLGRRIAVLGDMLELGPRGADLHRELAVAVLAHGVDLVFCCGPLMRALWEALPSSRKGGYAESSAALESQVVAAVQPGDAVMVKGSLGSRMASIVKALQSRYRREAPVLARIQASTING